MITILIVDDHEIVREGLKLILETSDKYEVIGEASNGQEALLFMQEHMPKVVLIDLKMPTLDGVSLLKAIKAARYCCECIMLTTFNEDALVKDAFKYGARGFLLKDTGRERLFETIDRAARGETVKDFVLKQPTIATIAITEREKFILECLARGDRSKEIALKLNVAERTIKSYLTKIYNKMGVNTRTEAVAIAIERKDISI